MNKNFGKIVAVSTNLNWSVNGGMCSSNCNLCHENKIVVDNFERKTKLVLTIEPNSPGWRKSTIVGVVSIFFPPVILSCFCLLGGIFSSQFILSLNPSTNKVDLVCRTKHLFDEDRPLFFTNVSTIQFVAPNNYSFFISVSHGDEIRDVPVPTGNSFEIESFCATANTFIATCEKMHLNFTTSVAITDQPTSRLKTTDVIKGVLVEDIAIPTPRKDASTFFCMNLW